MSQRNFHTSDLLQALDAQPHQLRAWLRLEPLASREKKRRSATSYTALDAFFLAVVKKLDAAGFAPKALQTFSENLYKALQRPPVQGEPDELALFLEGSDIWKAGQPPEGAMTLRIPLLEIRLGLLRYTGAHMLSPQLEMALLAPVRSENLSTVHASQRRKAS